MVHDGAIECFRGAGEAPRSFAVGFAGTSIAAWMIVGQNNA
jgi:hypothetical protein